MSAGNVEQIVARHTGRRGDVISILQDIQSKHGYLPEDALRVVAERTSRSLVDIYGVATFYRAFSLTPRGRHLCSLCLGTACHVRGSQAVLAALENRLGIRAGETTPDREFTLETVNCLGACALGPVVVVDGRYYPQVTPDRVDGILAEARSGADIAVVETDMRVFPVEVSCSRCNHSLMDRWHLVDGVSSIRVTVSFGENHGWLRLSSLYGSYSVESEYPVPMDELVHFFCPHCHTELNSVVPCADCGAPLVQMIVRGGGIIQICTRRGCKCHRLDLD